MVKICRLTKLKSAIKRWPSFTKLSRTNTSIAAAPANSNDHQSADDHHHHHHNLVSNPVLHAVYVGKSRRRYLLTSDIIYHPLFQELLDISGGGFDHDGGKVVVACEVVLFEHLLWMLESGSGSQLGSMEELAEFYYSC